MITVANVKLWGEMAGAVAWNEQTQAADFEFDRAFLAKGLDISPLQMPISAPRIYSFGALSRDTFVGLPGLLADSLPDAYGKVMLDRWLNLNNRSAANPIERLCYQSNRGMGALEFEPAQQIAESDSEKIEISSLIEVALTGEGAMFKKPQNPYHQLTEREIEEVSTLGINNALMKMYQEGVLYPAIVHEKILAEKNSEIAQQGALIQKQERRIWELERLLELK